MTLQELLKKYDFPEPDEFDCDNAENKGGHIAVWTFNNFGYIVLNQTHGDFTIEILWGGLVFNSPVQEEYEHELMDNLVSFIKFIKRAE